MNHVVFNGQTGGLGRYLAAALEGKKIAFSPLRSRLEETARVSGELDALNALPNETVTLIPLAGLVPVVACEKEPDRAFKTNVSDMTALAAQFLEWADRRNIAARVLYVSSGHVYAPKSAGQRVTETDPVLPRSVYARTKLQAEDALRALFKKHPEDLLIARVFGLLSPDQPLSYVLPSLIQRARQRNFLNMSGLDCVRDYLDSRDVCRVLACLAERDWKTLSRPANSVVNISSGEGIAIRDLFALVLETGGISWTDAEKNMTVSPPRPDDIAWMVGDPSALALQIKIPMRLVPLRQTVRDAFQTK